MPKPPPDLVDTNPIDAADQVLGELFPLGGPYTTERGLAAAYLVSELIRYLNHATGDAPARVMPWPSNANRVLMNLAEGMHRMPQLLQQVSRRIDKIVETEGDLFYVWDPENGGQVADPTETILETKAALFVLGGKEHDRNVTLDDLRKPQGQVGATAKALEKAASLINRMGSNRPDDEETQA
jgi:hypothetical protein